MFSTYKNRFLLICFSALIIYTTVMVLFDKPNLALPCVLLSIIFIAGGPPN